MWKDLHSLFMVVINQMKELRNETLKFDRCLENSKIGGINLDLIFLYKFISQKNFCKEDCLTHPFIYSSTSNYF